MISGPVDVDLRGAYFSKSKYLNEFIIRGIYFPYLNEFGNSLILTVFLTFRYFISPCLHLHNSMTLGLCMRSSFYQFMLRSMVILEKTILCLYFGFNTCHKYFNEGTDVINKIVNLNEKFSGWEDILHLMKKLKTKMLKF